MLYRLALILLPVTLMLAACSDGGTTTDDASPPDEASGQTTDAQDGDPDAGDADLDTDADGTSGDLLSAVNPFEVLSNLSGAPASTQDVDPALKGALLTSDDLPGDFLPFGDFGFTLPTEVGTVDMVANMFASGDLVNGDFGAMVMSAVMAVPPEALDELGDLDELQDVTEADLEEIRAQSEQLGIEFADLELLDASGLGDGGVGMHMEMDFSELFGAFGAPDEEVPFSGLAMDMYMFVRGQNMLMLMVMWPNDGSSGVDSHDLAEALDGRAAAS